MLVTDPIADMLTRIRNALIVKHDTVDVPVSVMKLAIADILLNEGYIKGYTVGGEGVQKMMTPLSTAQTVRRLSPASSVFPSPACAFMPARITSPRFSTASASPSFPLPAAS